MARTIAEIYNALNASKASMQELNDYVVSTQVPGSVQDNAPDLAIDITSGSRVARWRLLAWIFAVGSWMVEVLFDRHTSHVTEILESKRVHTLRWYADESKKWQYGYAMSWIDNEYKYEVDDENARIIRYAAASEGDGNVILKVAKDVGGTKAALSNLEKAAFEEFWSKWKDAGVPLDIVSQPADKLKINITIIRDRTVLDASNKLLRDNSVSPIANAIEAYGNSLEFDGIVRISELQEAIKAAEGVIDAKITSAYWKPFGGSYQPVSMSVVSAAGYFELSYSDSVFNYQDNVEVSIFD